MSKVTMNPGPVTLDVVGQVLNTEDRRRILDPLTGGVILFGRNFSNRKQLTKLTADIKRLRPDVLISIDTFQSKVAEAAIVMGAKMINDISCGSFDPTILDMVSKYNTSYIGMHITGTKETMHEVLKRENIIQELLLFFTQKKQLFAQKGIHHWIIDPGFGFGKTIEENFTIIKELNQLSSLELPILVGVSRKSSIYKTLGITPEEALNGTTVVNTMALKNGASILRVHDVKEAKQAIRLMELL